MIDKTRFITMIQYKPYDANTVTLDLDSHDLIIGLIGANITPLAVLTDRTRLLVSFESTEATAKYQALANSLLGLGEPFLVDYAKMVLAESLWRGWLAMLRNYAAQDR